MHDLLYPLRRPLASASPLSALSRLTAVPGLVLGILLLWLPVAAAAQSSLEIAEAAAMAQRYLDAGQAEEALQVLDTKVGRQIRGKGSLLLLRSTAHFMAGDNDKGRRDLDAALRADPTLRQAWQNRAALDLSEERYGEALVALGQAERLDPRALDNHLNIGAVYLLRGEVAEAAERFGRYLSGGGGTAEGYYLVATNYATAGQAELAVQHLARAIELEETSRVAARGDAAFRPLIGTASYDRLMAASPKPPAAGSLIARRAFPSAYQGGGGKLLPAVLSALQLAGESFDPRVEVTESWALIWGERFRIVVRNQRTESGEEGLVEISAPAGSATPEAWEARTDDLFRRIRARLITGG